MEPFGTERLLSFLFDFKSWNLMEPFGTKRLLICLFDFKSWNLVKPFGTKRLHMFLFVLKNWNWIDAFVDKRLLTSFHGLETLDFGAAMWIPFCDFFYIIVSSKFIYLHCSFQLFHISPSTLLNSTHCCCRLLSFQLQR